jgi:hypothetical protein
MAITKNPKRNTSEKKAEAFISGAGELNQEESARRTPVMLRIPSDMLPRIDKAAKRLGLTRSGFLVSSTAERLNRMEEE